MSRNNKILLENFNNVTVMHDYCDMHAISNETGILFHDYFITQRHHGLGM